MTVYVSPSLNANGADRPLGVAIALDGEVLSSYFIPPAAPGVLPAVWGGYDGFVANSIVPISLSFAGMKPGAHNLKVSHTFSTSYIVLILSVPKDIHD